MAKIKCRIDYGEDTNDEGYVLEATWATCSKCGAETTSFGTSAASVRRCLAIMKDSCTCPGSNFYIADNGDDQSDTIKTQDDYDDYDY